MSHNIIRLDNCEIDIFRKCEKCNLQRLTIRCSVFYADRIYMRNAAFPLRSQNVTASATVKGII